MEKGKTGIVRQVLTVISLLTPALTFAAETPSNFEDVILIIVNVLSALLPLITALAFFYFFWSLAQYLKGEGDNREEARDVMIHGIIAFFLMASLWGFVAMLTKTFGTESGTNIPPDLYGAQDPFEPEEEEEPQVIYI